MGLMGLSGHHFCRLLGSWHGGQLDFKEMGNPRAPVGAGEEESQVDPAGVELRGSHVAGVLISPMGS